MERFGSVCSSPPQGGHAGRSPRQSLVTWRRLHKEKRNECSLSPFYSIWDPSPWDDVTNTEGSSSLLCLTFLEMHSQTYLEMCFHGDYKYKQVGTEALVGISVSTDSSAPCFSPIPFYDLIPADDSAVFQGTSPNSPWTLLTQLITKSLISMDKYGLNCSPLLTTLGQIAARS